MTESQSTPPQNDFDFYIPRSSAPGMVMATKVTLENGQRLADRLPAGIWADEILTFHEATGSHGEAEVGDYVISDSGAYREVDKEVFEAMYQPAV